MNIFKLIVIVAALVAAGCASAKETSRHELVTGKIPKPEHIWVYDFAATPEDVPAGSALSNQPELQNSKQTAEDIAKGKEAGHELAMDLAADIRNVGMPAEVATAETKPEINDILIRGTILSIHEGDAEKRVAIGFSEGASELKTAVEGFQMTAQGLRKLGSGTADAEGGKTPGTAVGVVGLIATHNPAGLIVSAGMKVHGEETGSSTVEGRAKETAKEIADELKKRFQEQGWIN